MYPRLSFCAKPNHWQSSIIYNLLAKLRLPPLTQWLYYYCQVTFLRYYVVFGKSVREILQESIQLITQLLQRPLYHLLLCLLTNLKKLIGKICYCSCYWMASGLYVLIFDTAYGSRILSLLYYLLSLILIPLDLCKM